MLNKYNTIGATQKLFHSNQIKISIPKSVVNIQERTFYNNKKIKKVYIPKEVQIIGKESFMNCENLKIVSLSSNSKLKKIPMRAFANCYHIEEIIIPNNVVTIEEEAFLNCVSIEFLEIPETVKYLDERAFLGWTKEQSILIYHDYKFSDNIEATIIYEKDEEEEIEANLKNEIDKDGKYYYSVQTKCGHVGKERYILINFPIKAFNRREAAKIAREKPRVKRHHKDAIREVIQINYFHYYELVNNNPNEDYLSCKNIQEQRSLELDSRLLYEDRPLVKTKKQNKIKITNDKDIKKIIEDGVLNLTTKE